MGYVYIDFQPFQCYVVTICNETTKPFLTFNVADVENAEAKFDLAIRSNKWEGEDEDEDVKVLFCFPYSPSIFIPREVLLLKLTLS